MNISAFLGIIIAGIVIVYGTTSSTPNWHIFVNGHAALIVVGGTLAAMLVSFSVTHLVKISKIFVSRILGGSLPPHITVVAEVVSLSKGYYDDENYLQTNVEKIKNHFLRESIQLLVDGGITNAKMDVILRKRAEVHFVRYEDEAHIFKTAARFPPAFGLFGAVLGMVALMAGLGSPDSFKQIGPSMALALVATMYGIALANFVFVPLGENLGKFSKQDHLMRKIVIDAFKLIREREHPLVVEEYIKSYLLPSERGQLEKYKGAA